MGEWIGRTLSKVEVQKLVGRGGMADVYLGRHNTLDRPVAVKILQAHFSEDETLLSRFRSEAQSVAAMRHPHIVQVFDFDVADDRPYIVMELLEGPSLKDYLRGQREAGRIVPPKTIVRLIAGVAAALDYAHARGIVHRDIKPANIMLRREAGLIDPAATLPADAEPVLTDFGVARIANATVQTASGMIVGTPAYMSPEQVRGEMVDARTDIYALGIVLYEMLAGQLPFDADTQASILLQQINDPPPPLPHEYETLEPVLNRALAKNPADRFQKAGDLAAVLAASLGVQTDTGITEPHLRRDTMVEPGTVSVKTESGEAVTGTASGTSTAEIAGAARRALNPLWIVAAIGGLGLVLGVIALGLVLFTGDGEGDTVGGETAPTATTEPEASPTNAQPEESGPITGITAGGGLVFFRDSSVTVAMSDVPSPPEGMVYQAWLIQPDASPLDLGVVGVTDGQISFGFTDPSGAKVLSQYVGFALSLEEASDTDPATPGTIVYIGELAPDTAGRVRLLYSLSRATTLEVGAIQGGQLQANVFDSHINNTIAALNQNNLEGAQSHAEHTINIAAGIEGEEYGDWNNNDRPENPGDDVGMRTYLLILLDGLEGAKNAPGASDATQQAADELGVTLTAMLELVEQAIGLQKRIATADAIDEVLPLASQLDALHIESTYLGIVEQLEALDLTISVAVVPVE